MNCLLRFINLETGANHELSHVTYDIEMTIGRYCMKKAWKKVDWNTQTNIITFEY